jgi:hypothetical protein
MADIGSFYGNIYMETHMMRYQQSMKLAMQEQQNAMMVAQMLNATLINLDKQIKDVKGVTTGDDFNQLMKLYGMKQTSISEREKRQIQVYNQVNDIYDISRSLPTVNNAGETFANSLAAAGTVESKARRYAGTIGGYSRSTEQAKAVAAATYERFKADAYRKGYQSTFDANDSKIRQAIGDTMGVAPGNIDTVDAQKEAMLQDRLTKVGGSALSTSDLADIDARIQQLQAGGVSPEQQKGAIDALLAQRTQLTQQQTQALQTASRSPEESITRARRIYRSQYAPLDVQRREAFQNYLARLDPGQQILALGYETTKPGAAKFIFKPRKQIADDPVKAAAYDLYYSLQKERDAGKVPGYKLHEKVAELFPNDERKQEQVIGIILRATDLETPDSIQKTIERNARLQSIAEKKSFSDKDFTAAFGGVEGPKDPPPLPPGGEVGVEQEPADIPAQPAVAAVTPVTQLDLGTQFLMPYTSGGKTQNYGYKLSGFDPEDSTPVFTFLKLGSLEEGDAILKDTDRYKEALDQYNKQLEEANKAAAGDK